MNWFKVIGLISVIAGEVPAIVADGKVTVRELLELGVKIADKLGFDVDDEGMSLQPKTPTG